MLVFVFYTLIYSKQNTVTWNSIDIYLSILNNIIDYIYQCTFLYLHRHVTSFMFILMEIEIFDEAILIIVTRKYLWYKYL